MVAVKLPHLDRFHSAPAQAVFIDEARHAAQLDHPNIVPVYDAGEDQGWLYIVYKLIDGRSLSQRLRDRSFSCAESAKIVAQLARALGHAHQHGIYHRDVKPSN